MKNIIEFAGIISIANNIKFKSFPRFQKCMFYFGFEYGDLLPGESMELCFNFGIVDNGNFLEIIL